MRHTGQKWVIARHEAALAARGLTNLAGVKSFQGELVKDHRRRRDILKLCVPSADGHPVLLFLKRNWKPYKKDGLNSLWRRGRVWSQSREEWENSLALQRAGLNTAPLVAYGEDCGPLWERFSCLLTEAAPGGQTLDEFIRVCRDHAVRRRVFAALAGEIRRMHDAGLATPDLFCRHIFVDASGLEPKFCLIDMARLDRRDPLPGRLRARDLAALNATAPLNVVSARERVRFLHAYTGHIDRRLFREIEKRVGYLLKRRKFQNFHTPAA